MKTYIGVVDNHIHFTKVHNTCGVYIVVGRNEKDAKRLLQSIIGFGSIDICEVNNNSKCIQPIKDEFTRLFTKANRGTCYQYIPNGGLIMPHHANDNHESWDQLPEKKEEVKSWYLSRRMRNSR